MGNFPTWSVLHCLDIHSNRRIIRHILSCFIICLRIFSWFFFQVTQLHLCNHAFNIMFVCTAWSSLANTLNPPLIFWISKPFWFRFHNKQFNTHAAIVSNEINLMHPFIWEFRRIHIWWNTCTLSLYIKCHQVLLFLLFFFLKNYIV